MMGWLATILEKKSTVDFYLESLPVKSLKSSM